MDYEKAIFVELLADLRGISQLVGQFAKGDLPQQKLNMLVLHVCDVREKWVCEAARQQGIVFTKH